jgi:hypothetical protein
MESLVHTIATDVWLLIILTNIAYLFPAILAWLLRIYDLVAILALVSIISPMHHICYDLGLCDHQFAHVFSFLDVMTAYFAMAIALMYVVNRDLIRLPKHIANNERITAMFSSSIDENETNVRYVLQKHTYADIASITYFIVIIFAVLGYNGRLVEPLIIGGYGLIMTGLSFLFYWPMKIKHWRRRFNHWFLLAALVSAIVGSTFYGGESIIGRSFHAPWHVCGALTCTFLILAASGHRNLNIAPSCTGLFARG